MLSDPPLWNLPDNLPPPHDDGAARHLQGQRIVDISLAATDGRPISLGRLTGPTVVFFYPRTGQPGMPDLVPDWESIPGACGCTAQVCGFRDGFDDFTRRGITVLGVSTQESAYQQEMARRLAVPFPFLSDDQLALTRAMRLPTFDVAGHILIKRMMWSVRDGTVERVFYPVFPPSTSAQLMRDWIDHNFS